MRLNYCFLELEIIQVLTVIITVIWYGFARVINRMNTELGSKIFNERK